MNGKRSKYLDYESWESFFKDRGFEEAPSGRSRWYIETDGLTWWCHGDFAVGVVWRPGRFPILNICFKPCDVDHINVIKDVTASDIISSLQFLESLANPELMPLCINDGWCRRVIDSCMKEYQVTV